MTTTDATPHTDVPDTPAELTEQPSLLPPAPNVIAALNRVMAELPNIGRDLVSPQGYNYRGIEQITQHAQPLFAKHGVVLAPYHITWHDVTNLIVNNKPWTDEKLMVTYRCYGPGGPLDYIEIEVPGIGRDNADKGSNKAMTQAFKYALIQALCIADGKDDADASPAYEADAPVDPATAPARPPQMARIRELCQTLRDRGLEVTETNDLKEVTVLGVPLLERRDDEKLYAAVTALGADDLIGTLNAKLADLLLGDGPPESPYEQPRPSEPGATPPPTDPEPYEAPRPSQSPEQAERERVAREQLLAVGGSPEPRKRTAKAKADAEPAPEA